MRKTVFKVLTVATLLISQNTFAWTWRTDRQTKQAIEIEMAPQGLKQTSGQSTRIDGELNLIDYKPSRHTRSKSDLKKALKDKQLTIKAFYPDFVTEVTDQLTIDANYNFRFNTPALNPDSLNQFIVQVSYPNPKNPKYQALKSKIELQIQYLEAHIAELKRKKKNKYVIAALENTVRCLKQIIVKINGKISRQPELVAERRISLQVDNRVAGAQYQSSLIGAFRFVIESIPGVSIEGESTLFKTKIMAIDQDANDDDDDLPIGDRKDEWHAKAEFNNAVVVTTEENPLRENDEISFEYLAQNLNPSKANKFEVALYSSRKLLFFWKYKNKLYSEFSLSQPTIDDSVAPVWAAGDAVAPLFSAKVTDAFGKIDADTVTAKIGSQVLPLQKTVSNHGAVVDVSGDLTGFTEGAHTIRLDAKDYAGNSAQALLLDVTIDLTKPVIAVNVPDATVVNSKLLSLSFTTTDATQTTTTVKLNDQVVLTSTQPTGQTLLNLIEGQNRIELTAVDATGNIADPVVRTVTVDSTPPVLSDFEPSDGDVLFNLTAQASVESNEPLQSVSVRGQVLTLNDAKTEASGNISLGHEGENVLEWQAVDLAGNIATYHTTVQVIQKVIRVELVSIVPDTEQETKLAIIGAAGAAYPGASITSSSGLFNSESTTAAANGSFQIIIDFAQSFTVKATSSELGRTDEITLNYNVDTRLSGIVKDTDGRGLPNAKVSISGGESVFTNATGMFLFENPVSGDQMLEIDGSSVTDPCTMCIARKFGNTSVKITLGINQSNVLQRPVFMAPILQDGSEVEVNPTQQTVVTSEHAPGVQLTIPANAIASQPGSGPLKISMQITDASVSVIEVPAFAKPNQVITLEPSGLQFSKPVAVTLPNDNELPVGTNLVIMSFNSKKGLWEPDGVVVVDSNGTSMTTKPNMGITHFSQIYAVPTGPRVTPFGAQDKRGANTFDGALTTQIAMPSYKALGESIAPSLSYKSAWAKPNVLMTNIFDIPRNEINITQSAGARIFGVTFGGSSIGLRSWIEPQKVTSKFLTKGVNSDTLEFTGVPNKAAVSYLFDLNHLVSGAYSYFSHWEILLKNVIIQTVTIQQRRSKFFGPVRTSTYVQDLSFDQLFPQDLGGNIYVQNKTQSEAGRGWKITGPQRIVNPDSDHVMIEEENGEISSYAIENTINDYFSAQGTPYYLNEGVRFDGDRIYLNTAIGDISQVSIIDEHKNASVFGHVQPATGTVYFNMFLAPNVLPPYKNIAFPFAFTGRKTPTDYLKIGGDIYYTSANYDQIVKLNSASSSTFAGTFKAPWTPFDVNRTSTSVSAAERVQMSTFCFERHEFGCTLTTPAIYSTTTDFINSVGEAPNPGVGGNTIADIQFNNPKALVAHPAQNAIIVADQGNHRVVALNLDTQAASVIAGNGQTIAKVDGVNATDSSLVDPIALSFDTANNLYILTLQGYVRRVGLDGKIITVAGLPETDPDAEYSLNAPAERASLKNPSGMTIDKQRNILFIADSGHHRVLEVDLSASTPIAKVIAGNGNMGDSGSNGPGLAAELNLPTQLGIDSNGNLLINDSGNNKIKKLNFAATSGTGALAFKPTVKDNTTLAKNDMAQEWVRRYRNGTEVHFDLAGYEIYRRDRIGRVTSFEYDAQGKLIRQIDPTNQVVTYHYAGNKLSDVVDPAGRMTRFTYNGNDLVQVIYPDNTTRQFAYDANGLMVEEKNQRGNPTTYTYNEWGRLAQVTRADNSSVQVNDMGSSTAANNFIGGNIGQLKSITDNSQLYDGIKDPRNIETRFNKDENGYVTKIVDAKNQTTTIERDLEGKPTKITRPDNNYVTFAYDSVSNDLILQYDSSLNSTTSQSYDTFGNLVSSTNARHFTSTQNFDFVTGLLLSKTSAASQVVSYSYNALGLPQVVTNPLHQTTTYTYDTRGNALTVKDALNKTLTYVFDNAGNAITKTDAANKSTQYEYDLMNRLIAVVTPKNERTEYSYLTTGELATIKDPKNNVTTFEYNVLGNLIKKTDSLGQVITREYDDNGNLTQEIDPNGNVKTFVYDNVNQLIKKTLPDNVIDLDYDVKGNLAFAQNNESQLNITYNTSSRPITVSTAGRGALSDQPELVLNYDYDANGNRISMMDGSGTTNYTYDSVDRLTHLTNVKGETFHWSYDQGNRLEQINRPNTVSVFTFDSSNFLTSIVHNRGGSTLGYFNYEYDNAGNRTKVKASAGDKIFDYDLNDQLVSATNPEVIGAKSNETFNYDDIYNRTQDESGNYTYDNKSIRLIEDYRYFYFYDNNGNLTSKQSKNIVGEVTNYSYSSENQLKFIKVYFNNNLQKESYYFYDVLGRRMRKQVIDHVDSSKSFERRYSYDSENMLFEYGGDNNKLARYTLSHLSYDDVLAVDIKSGGVTQGLAKNQGTYYYLKDALGTVIDITDSNGSLVQHYVYSSFGSILKIKDASSNDIINDPNISTMFTFTGREFDVESNNFYYRARYYDANIGRFLQKDPNPGKLQSAQTVNNSYTYVLNNSQKFTDATGEIAFGAILIVAAFAIVGAAQNYIDAKSVPGTSSKQVFWSTFSGAVTGAMTGAGAITMNPLTAWLLSTAAVALNNTANQFIFTGRVKAESVLLSAGIAAITSKVSAVLTKGVFDRFITVYGQQLLTESFATAASTTRWYKGMSGIPDSAQPTDKNKCIDDPFTYCVSSEVK